MFISSTLGYIFIGATISWASPVPMVAGDVVNAQTANHTNIQRKRDGNCLGSGGCAFVSWIGPSTPVDRLLGQIYNLPDDSWYSNGHHIACTVMNVCAFLQYMPTPNGTHIKDDPAGGAYGKHIKDAAVYMTVRGCRVCGSISMIDDDVKHGELTFDIVSHR